MTKSQTVTEINRTKTDLPKSKLEDLLLYLKQIKRTSQDKMLNDSLLDDIFEEDRALLKDLEK